MFYSITVMSDKALDVNLKPSSPSLVVFFDFVFYSCFGILYFMVFCDF